MKGIYSYLKALEKVGYPFQVVVITGGDNALYTKLGKKELVFSHTGKKLCDEHFRLDDQC